MTTNRRNIRVSLAFALIAVTLLALVSTGVLLAARSDKWWWDNLGGPSSSHYVTLDQINKANVKNLQVAWFYPHGNTGFNPVVVEDTLYVSGRNNSLIALD